MNEGGFVSGVGTIVPAASVEALGAERETSSTKMQRVKFGKAESDCSHVRHVARMIADATV